MNQYEGKHSREVTQNKKKIYFMTLFISFLLGAVVMALAVVLFQ